LAYRDIALTLQRFLQKKGFAMKLLAHSRLIRILAAAGLLGVLIFAGYATYKHSIAQACVTNHLVAHSNTAITDNLEGISGTLSLWFNNCTGNNTGVFTLTAGSTATSAELDVIKYSGGVPVAEQSIICGQSGPWSGTCTTPNLNSPNNPAQACWETGSNGIFDNVKVCTDLF
jgi:hypothetical protein